MDASDFPRMQIPFFRPSLTEAEIDEVVACMRSGWLTTGAEAVRDGEGGASGGETRRGRQLRHRGASSGRRGTGPGAGPRRARAHHDVRRHGRSRALSGRRPLAGRLRSCDAEYGHRGRRAEDRAIAGRPNAFRPRTACGRHDSRTRGRFDDGHGRSPGVCHQARSLGHRGRRAQFSRGVSPLSLPTNLRSSPGEGRGEVNSKAEQPSPNPLPAGEGTGRPLLGGRGPGVLAALRREHLGGHLFSFYANKTMTTGRRHGRNRRSAVGRPDAADVAARTVYGAWKRYAGNHAWDYRIVAPGYKYNLTDIAAAIGIHQIARAEEMRRSRDDCPVLPRAVGRRGTN